MTPKTYKSFIQSMKEEEPDILWPEALKALWYDGRGNWEMAHNIAQDIASVQGNWIHAYLHRKEGDKWNASYWYQRAGKEYPRIGLQEEFQELARAVIKSHTS